MQFQLVTAYRVSHLQRYGVTVRGNVTSVYQPLSSSPQRHQLASNQSLLTHIQRAQVCYSSTHIRR
jgi:hypothetical protein